MAGKTCDHYDAFPDPSPELVPVGPGQLDRLDDALHFAWAWQRHRFVFRKAEGLSILDAGCGTGLSTLALARLNPGSTAVGIDVSPRSLEIARGRAAASETEGVEFLEHDLATPLPARLGPFDFIVARGLIGDAEEAGSILATLSRSLDARGLLLADFPTSAGRMAARQLRRAAEALVPAGASLAETAEAGIDLLRALHPDHPIRRSDAARHGASPPGVARFVAAYLNDRSAGWTLEGAIGSLGRAGLAPLYAADRGGWRPERVFGTEVPERLRSRVAALDAPTLGRLKDSLDPTIHPDTYALYACPIGHEPHVPTWPDDPDSAAIGRLIPHPTGLSTPAGLVPDPAGQRGRVTYRTANGAIGELERRSDAVLRLADGRRPVSEIEDSVGPPATPEAPDALRVRWTDLAHFGFLVLESTDPRQNIDCVHLGAVKDRLDCACPRRWVRACEVHTLCTIAVVRPDDPKRTEFDAALARFGVDQVVACELCPDYSPEA